jgi:hypothetical protein
MFLQDPELFDGTRVAVRTGWRRTLAAYRLGGWPTWRLNAVLKVLAEP